MIANVVPLHPHKEPWYQETKSGFKIIPGILARHFIETSETINVQGNLMKYDDGRYRTISEDRLKGMIKKEIADEYVTTSILNSVMKLWTIDEDVHVEVERLNRDEHYINLKNGMYGIYEGQLFPHSPDYLSTIQLNVDYDPYATAPEFQAFLDKQLPENAAQETLQEIMGYACSKYVQAEKFFILRGASRTGKSTVINILQEIIGVENTSNIPLQKIGDRFFIAEGFGKIANLYGDLPSAPVKDTGTIKSISGQDLITGEKKNKDPFQYKSFAKLIFATNQLPSFINEGSDAILKRLEFLDFDVQVQDHNIDPFLKEKLLKEKEGIFLWALKGLIRLINNGFKFTKNLGGEKVKEKFKMKNNSVMYFVENHCSIDPNNMMPKKELYAQYEAFAFDQAIRAEKRIRFYEIFEAHYPNIITKQISSKKNERYLIGIQVK